MYIDFLIKIKNAERAGKKSMKAQFSTMDYAVAEELVRFGFLKKAEIRGRAPKRTIEAVFNPARQIQGVRFMSRPSLRRYAGYADLRPVKNGNGILMVSTSKGVMSGVRAKKEKVGGQVLFEVW